MNDATVRAPQAPPRARAPRHPVLYAAIVAILGLLQTAGGLYLATLGGSLYYLLSGILIVASAWFVWRRDERGMWLYALFVVVTLVWAFVDVGLNFWAVVARVSGPIVLGLWFLFPSNRRRLTWPWSGTRRPSPVIAVLLAISAVAISAGASKSPVTPEPGRFPEASATPPSPSGPLDWPAYGRDLAGVKYVPTAQINRDNIAKLDVAWTYRTGDKSLNPVWEMTPLQIGDSLYLCTPARQIIALDAVTGKQRWRFVPASDKLQSQNLPMCRGVSYHADATAGGVCSQRILSTTFSGDLWAIDAPTGRPCADFGRGGVVSLLDGLGPMSTRDMVNTTPGVVVGDLLIVGGQVVDGKSTDEPSGVIRAFDAHSGAVRWAWDMGSPPGSPPSAGHTFTRSTPNAWTSFAADPALGLVYVPTGNPSPDFFGGLRRPYDEKYSVSLVALDVATGRPRWSFQAVHHDLWDLDLPAQPILIDWPTPQGNVPAVVQLTKTGDIFVLDRRTGIPLVPVKEVPVPQTGGVPDDRLSPTQPVSALSFAQPALRESDMWGVTQFDQILCRIAFRSCRYDGAFTPPGLTQAIGLPATSGIFSWSGAAFDPVHRVMVANTNNMPWVNQLIARASTAGQGKKQVMEEYGLLGQVGTPYLYKTRSMLSVLGMPCRQPPWGELIAFDLATRRAIWRKPLGQVRDNGPFGVRSHLPITLGVPNAGGSIITAGGIVFIGAATDRYFRAIDLRTGAELWRHSLPAAANATPISYVARNGRQYVVVTAGGHGYLGTRGGDYLMAFALRE